MVQTQQQQQEEYALQQSEQQCLKHKEKGKRQSERGGRLPGWLLFAGRVQQQDDLPGINTSHVQFIPLLSHNARHMATHPE